MSYTLVPQPAEPYLRFKVVYHQGDHAFNTLPPIQFYGYTLSVNEIGLPLTPDYIFLCAHGYCPIESWTPCKLYPPKAEFRQLKLMVDKDLVPGVTMPIHRERFQAFFDESGKWFCLGDHSRHDFTFAIEFAPGSILVVDQNIVRALWLRIDDFV
jgi:hypothetical protein